MPIWVRGSCAAAFPVWSPGGGSRRWRLRTTYCRKTFGCQNLTGGCSIARCSTCGIPAWSNPGRTLRSAMASVVSMPLLGLPCFHHRTHQKAQHSVPKLVMPLVLYRHLFAGLCRHWQTDKREDFQRQNSKIHPSVCATARQRYLGLTGMSVRVRCPQLGLKGRIRAVVTRAIHCGGRHE